MQMKWIDWIIALLGVWEAADILGLFVPGFGEMAIYVWNHIGVGLIWIIDGVLASLTDDARSARRWRAIALAAGLWLIASTLILRLPAVTAGLWNDLIVGASAVLLSGWAVLRQPR